MSRMRSWLHWLRRNSADEHGATTVIFALMLPLIVGVQMLVVDESRIFVERRELQNAADAAALAAAQFLPTSDPLELQLAADQAITYAAANGVTITVDDVVFSTDVTMFDRVTVRTEANAPFFFAKSIGLTMGAVSSQGMAQLGVMGGMMGVMPWGAEEPPGGFVFGEAYCLKMGSNGGGGVCNQHDQGNFYALDIDDTGTSSADVYRDRILSGSQTVVRIGQVKNVASGNMNGPTAQGTGCSGNGGRIQGDTSTFSSVVEDTGDSYRVLDWSSPRLVIIPRVEFPDSQHAEILGFSAFFIEQCGSNGAVVGRFVDTVVPGGEWAPYEATAASYGLMAVRLVQ